ncbi:MAG TPA: sugar phosphate isomerase/epimerase [Burkholderiales bacterium]|nr:sugar phosphate isomerase/epimerase [Burkholderiales bacterium]
MPAALHVLQQRIALHTWTLDTTPLPEVLEVAREAGFDAIETRYEDFKRCADVGLSEARALDLIRSSGLAVSVMGTEYGLIFAQGEEVARLLGSLERTCEQAQALGCDMIMVAPGPNAPTTLEHAAENFRKGGEVAQRYGVRFSLEFNSRHSIINTIGAARRILELASHPSCGLLLDAYHMHYSGLVGRAFTSLPLADLFTFQYSDAPPGEMSQVRTALDRLPPGQGVIPWIDVFQGLMEMGYEGWLNYEAPNPALWSRPPLEVAREGVSATRKLLAEAEAGLAPK